MKLISYKCGLMNSINKVNYIHSKFSTFFAFLILIKVSPLLIISVALGKILVFKLELKVWLFLFPFFMLTIAMCYYLIKEVKDNTYQRILLTKDSIEIKKFFDSTLMFKFKDVSRISFEWNRTFRYIFGFRPTYRPNGFPISNQNDRNAGGKNIIIKMYNGLTIKIYEHQFSNSEELFNEIIERVKFCNVKE